MEPKGVSEQWATDIRWAKDMCGLLRGILRTEQKAVGVGKEAKALEDNMRTEATGKGQPPLVPYFPALA